MSDRPRRSPRRPLRPSHSDASRPLEAALTAGADLDRAPSLPRSLETLAPGSEVSCPLRWARLARRVDLDPSAPVLVALSGGADSVFLLQLLHAALESPRILAVHVDHGLRGEASSADAAFCARLTAALGIPFVRREVELDADGPDLERRAREARYRVLVEEARRAGLRTLLTGHHADDALETLMIRWLRGTDLAGLAGLRRRTRLGATFGLGPEDPPMDVVRPLFDLRRAEIRDALLRAGLAWREDASNRDPRFTRNRVRSSWLPSLEAAAGPEALAGLHAFQRSVEEFEGELARHTAHIDWRPPRHAAASRSRRTAFLGGTVGRRELLALPSPLRRRTLWRLLAEGCGGAPSRSSLEALLADLEAGRCARHSLVHGWALQLRSDLLHLSPPARVLPPPVLARPSHNEQLPLPFPGANPLPEEDGLALPLPGLVQLGDGRALSVEELVLSPGSSVPRSAVEVELEAPPPGTPLRVRLPRPGDRFHGLGAPGSKPLVRFLADAGLPREDRARVPLVFFGQELAWVAGVRPCERYRVRQGTRRRLRLRLLDAAPVGAAGEPGELF